MLLFSITIFSVSDLAAQEDTFDTKGRDFWLGFPPNFHNNRHSPDLYQRYGDSLYIFIVADKPTTGTIEYWDITGNRHEHNFNITDISQVYVFKESYYTFEVFGYNNSGEIQVDGNDCERVVRRAFHVTSNDDITVYAHSQAVMTSEAFMVYPTDVLGDSYLVMSYHSDGSFDFGTLSGVSTPSQFLVVATEDDTEVTITPSEPTFRNGISPRQIYLDRGQLYLVQARIDPTNEKADLTGSIVESNKPVAVFGSHQRTPFPKQNSIGASRDILIEQMPPTTVWGTTAYITEYANVPSTLNEPDRFRVLASHNNTRIYINGTLYGTIDRGEYIDEAIYEAYHVSASQPVLVAQFRKTSQIESQTMNGDPFMMIIPPFEQFGREYRFINLQAYEFERVIMGNPIYRQVYELQFITIISKYGNLPSIRLDGNPVNQGMFRRISDTDYYYANLSVSDGVHHIVADDIFGLYVYGMGIANSYGYVGGMSMRPLDTDPPEIVSSQDCRTVDGTIYDTLKYDSQLVKVESPDEFEINMDVNIDFHGVGSTARFDGTIGNIYLDGSFRIVATDGAGFVSQEDFEIPGFTIAPEPMRETGDLAVRAVETALNKERCFSVTVHNYGKFDGLITRAYFKNPDSPFRLNETLPIPVGVGQMRDISICFASAEEGEYVDTLVIGNECFDREVLLVTGVTKGDRDKPQANYFSDSCKTEIEITFTEELPTDLGIKTIEILDTTNCIVEINEISYPNARVRIRIADPMRDAYYKIAATDSSGNQTIYEEAIPGMTLEITGLPAEGGLDFGDRRIGDLACDTIDIRNYGSYPITIDKVFIYNKIYFTFPESQLPLVIAPGESVPAKVCFRAVESKKEAYRDTLTLNYICFSLTLPLSGRAEAIVQERPSKCGLPVRLIAQSVPERFLMEQNKPNPVTGDAGKIVFGVPAATNATVAVYDVFGNRRAIIASGRYDPGIYEIEFDATQLPSGMYIYALEAPGHVLRRKMIISR
ncbi:MAG: T9SS type A sorting domain-containing protein [Candidatus Kapaibacterium sp.]